MQSHNFCTIRSLKNHVFPATVGTGCVAQKFRTASLAALAIFIYGQSFAQVLSPRELKKLSIEQLMNVEVTLVSRTPQKLTEAASAIQVITGEDIRRSGATNVAEALRLVANLQVSQLNSEVWIIGARGFNSIFSNKLLVMIDGRTVYTPLYGGVLWEQQNPLLEDIDRIEVVSGPGGTLWGPNAVNGIINIITKSAGASQGLYASVSTGVSKLFGKSVSSSLKDNAALRYGGKIGDKAYYKIYGQHFDRNSTEQPDGSSSHDAWHLNQGGFRVDMDATDKDAVTIDGEYYGGGVNTAAGTSDLNGQHLLTRWTKTISDRADLQLQAYFDRYYREDAPSASYDKMKTLDFDLQHHFGVGDRQNLVWGAGYRFVKDESSYPNTASAGILPPVKRLDLFSGFVQDEITLVDSLRLIVGTKLLHNAYTGWDWQPSARLAWIHNHTTLWAAVTRAVRTPSRFDVDYFLPQTPQPPTSPSVAGGPNFVSEKLHAYELGFRFQPNQRSSFSIATFYNIYHDLYSVEPLPGTLTYQIQNGSEGTSWGAEFSGAYQLAKNWRIRAGYTYFDKNLHAKPGHNFNPDYLGNDVRNQAMLQSVLDISKHFQFDFVGRHLDGLHKTFATAAVPSYFTFDARLAYARKGLVLALVGQNLAQKNHAEFGTALIPRGVYAKITARF